MNPLQVARIVQAVGRLAAEMPPDYTAALAVAGELLSAPELIGPPDPPADAWAVYERAGAAYQLPAELLAAVGAVAQAAGSTPADALRHAATEAARQIAADRGAGYPIAAALRRYASHTYGATEAGQTAAELVAALLAYLARRTPQAVRTFFGGLADG